ncbi:MAG: hypothetical protein GXO89_03140 [Chlorobi bacterium]|nr:hypothetical protein [Chlorobiota bacterium]
MKKTTLIIIALSFIVAAQSQTKPHFISINIGASVPIGDYGKSSSTKTDGFAKTGANFAIEGAVFINNTIGFGGYIGGNAHNIDDVAYTAEINKIPGILSSNLTADPYAISNYMLGVYINAPASEGIFFRFKALGGSFVAKSPAMTLTFTDDNLNSDFMSLTSATGSKLALLLGGSVLFKVSKRIGLSANLEYTGAECEFKYSTGLDTITVKQKFSIFNITGGLNIML